MCVCVDPQRCTMSVFYPGVRSPSPCESDRESSGTREGSDDKTTWKEEEDDNVEQPDNTRPRWENQAGGRFCAMIPLVVKLRQVLQHTEPSTLVMWNGYVARHEEHTCRWTAGCKHQSGDVAPGSSSWKLVCGTLWSRRRHTERGYWWSTPSSGETKQKEQEGQVRLFTSALSKYNMPQEKSQALQVLHFFISVR